MAVLPEANLKGQGAVDSPLVVNSVHKAFRVLKVFSPSEPRLTLKQIAEKLDIDKSTAQRFTHTLLMMGYLDKDPVTKALGVTVKLVDFARIYLVSSPLTSAAMPYLLHLSGETGETCNLTVLEGSQAVFVSRIVGRHLLSTGVIIGTRLPAFASSGGLAMMSTLETAKVERLLEQSDLRPFTSSTVYEPARILARLKVARSKGYALSVGDYFPSDISLGAPVMSRTGKLLGAISLSVSNDRFSVAEAEKKFARVVAGAAKSVLV